MVDMDGNITQPQDEEAPAEYAAPEEYAPPVDNDATQVGEYNPINDFLTEPQQSEEPAADFAETAPMDTEEPAVAFADMNSEESSVSAEGAESTESAYSEDFLDSLNSSEPVDPEVTEANDPLGITRFDGTDSSQMVDGPYYYDVIVSGIDTASLKQQVVDALTDRRLNWSQDDIKKNIKMGQLQLLNLNPVRAVLVVLKLQPLDVDVEWDQKLYTKEPGPGPDQEMT